VPPRLYASVAAIVLAVLPSWLPAMVNLFRPSIVIDLTCFMGQSNDVVRGGVGVSVGLACNRFQQKLNNNLWRGAMSSLKREKRGKTLVGPLKTQPNSTIGV